MKIELPKELREEILRVRSGLNPNLPMQQSAALPDEYLTVPAILLGKVLDFYLTAVERAYAAANAEFYGDWPAAMEAGRKTPAYQAVLSLRITAHQKQSADATAGNIGFFCEHFDKALSGQINLRSTPTN